MSGISNNCINLDNPKKNFKLKTYFLLNIRVGVNFLKIQQALEIWIYDNSNLPVTKDPAQVTMQDKMLKL